MLSEVPLADSAIDSRSTQDTYGCLPQGFAALGSRPLSFWWYYTPSGPLCLLQTEKERIQKGKGFPGPRRPVPGAQKKKNAPAAFSFFKR